jgi:3-methylfumaryl-CoA hydratase
MSGDFYCSQLVGLRHDYSDTVTAEKVNLYEVLFGSSGNSSLALIHWGLFRAYSENLRMDGHPEVLHPFPELPFPRRMWIGGELKWHSMLCVDDPVQQKSKVESAVMKDGRSGKMLLTRVSNRVSSNQQVCIEEMQTSAFLSAGKYIDKGHQQDTGFPVVKKFALSTSQVDLFRYSAFTGNGHRIHYDLPYARDLEGYPGLVVHGPYLVSMLVEQALAHTGLSSPRHLEYRLTHPLFQSEGYEIAFGELEHAQMQMAIINGNGQVTLSACLTFDLSKSRN